MIPIFYHDIVTPSGHPGDEVISALQKFIRRGETELAVRAAYELYLTGEELTAYLWRRLLVISAEDVGLGEPMAPVVVDALHRSSRELSRDSSDYQLLFVHAVRYLCAPACLPVWLSGAYGGETPFPCLIMCMTCTR